MLKLISETSFGSRQCGGSAAKYVNVPTASIRNLGKIIQYVGPDGALTQGFFYKSIGTPIASIIAAAIGSSTGITEATVTKSTFETLITESGEYIFEFRESIANAVIGESTGITSASVVKATFEDLITESGAYDFIFTDSLISASTGESTGITSATVDKPTFEGKLSVTGEYPFEFAASTANADIAASTGITSASVVKATFEEQIDETSTNTFVYNASTASASVGESVGITEATVNKATFESVINVSGEYDFVFDGTDWKLGEDTVTLADYGIVATGTPQLNDTITVTYVAEKWTLSDVEVDLADYGITFEGTPVDTDTIVIGYTAANWYYDENIIVLSEYGITIVGTPDDGDIVTISYTQSKWELDSTVVDLEDYGITYVGVSADGDIITVDYASDNWYLEDEIVDIASYGIVVTGTPNYEDTVVITYASAYTEYSWSNINVQAGSAEQVALLSVTTAPSGSFAVGSKYYNSSTKKIVTAVTADTWTGATSADPVFNTIYTFNSGYYIWDGDNLVTTDLDTIVRGVEVDGVSVVDSNKIAQIPVASDSVLGVVKVDGTTITAIDGVISSAGGSSLENVMYFAPANIGTGDGSSWENAKAFTVENYTAMTAGYTALLKYGTYAVPSSFDTIKGKNIIGGFTGVGTEKIKPYVIYTDGVWGGDGNTTFNDYATIFTQDWRTQINCYVEGIVFYKHWIEVDNVNPETSAGKVHNCIIANNADANLIKRGVTVSDTLFLNGYRVSSSADEAVSLFVYFTGCHFKNTRDTGNGGGAIQSTSGGVNVVNCKFENCNAFGPNNGGGAVFQATIVNSIAIGCKTANKGGAFYSCWVKNSCAIGCTADINQGAFAGCILDNAVAIGCTAPAYPAYDPADNTGTPTVTPQIDTNTVFTQTENKTIANTTVETSLVGAGVGSMTLPAYLLSTGKTLFVKGKGFLSGLSSESATLKVKLGETELINSGSTYPKAFSEVGFDFELLLTCRTIGETGTVIAQGGTIIYDGTAITTSYNRELKMTTTATINTTIAQLLDFTYTFGTADEGNTITLTNLIVETLN